MGGTAPGSPNGKIRLALTVDDLLLWSGTPVPKQWDPINVAKSLTEAFSNHRVKEVYNFSSTEPSEDNPSVMGMFDHWVTAGHHVANHTHYHPSLIWVSPDSYINDIEKNEALINRWTSVAPTKYFRYCMDMWGETAEKRDAVEAYLKRTGYTSCPIALWFYDHAFIVPHYRAYQRDDRDALAYLRRTFVDTAIEQFKLQTDAAYRMFGRHPDYIWLTHGSPIAAECLSEILDKLAELGVEFIALEEAMKDEIYATQPVVTGRFRNMIQKWAEAKGVDMPGVPPAFINHLDHIAPIDGCTTGEVYHKLMLHMCEKTGGTFSWPGWD